MPHYSQSITMESEMANHKKDNVRTERSKIFRSPIMGQKFCCFEKIANVNLSKVSKVLRIHFLVSSMFIIWDDKFF